MRETGKYVETVVAGEKTAAFLSAPHPPQNPTLHLFSETTNLVFWFLIIFCFLGCGANKVTDDALEKSAPPNAPHHEESVKEDVVKPGAALQSPIDEKAVKFSQRQQDRTLNMAPNATIPNDLARQSVKSTTIPSPQTPPPAEISKALTNGPSPLTPKLEAIVGALRAIKGQKVVLRKELAMYEKDFAAKDFNELPSEKMIAEIVEVKKKHLMMAFISVVDEGAVPCHDEIDDVSANADCVSSEDVYALHIVQDKNGRDRLAFRDWDAGMQLFGSTSPEVVFPKKASNVPVIEVRYDIDAKRGSHNCDTAKLVEVYHLAMHESITGKVFRQLVQCRSGETTENRSNYVWVPSKVSGRVFLVNVSHHVWQTFCTSDDDDLNEPRCHQVLCERTTELSIVTSDNVFDPTKKEIEELRKSEPGLAKLPPDMEGNTEKECKKIRNLGF